MLLQLMIGYWVAFLLLLREVPSGPSPLHALSQRVARWTVAMQAAAMMVCCVIPVRGGKAACKEAFLLLSSAKDQEAPLVFLAKLCFELCGKSLPIRVLPVMCSDK